ncbi:MAG TPA: sulfatase [Pirellulaceae bacterium]|nr:sulfatase [Pirellulaceae bacterium]
MRPVRTMIFVAAVTLVSMMPITARADERRPNVVFFLVDDLGWRDLGCYGSSFYETPNIDRFAEQGVSFTQAYATCHVCSPTRASIMTGKYPARLQLTDWLPGRREFPFQKLKNAEIHQHLPLEEITIAEALKAHGYRTAHIGKWHLGEEPFGPLHQGFDMQIPRWNKGWPKSGYHAPFKLDGLDSAKGEYLTDRLTDEAEKFIEARKDQPFFLYMAHFAVHDPIQGREDLVRKYQRKLEKMQRPKGPAFILEGNPDAKQPLSREELKARMHDPAWSGYRVLPDRTVKIKQHQDNIHFAAMVESVDESLGRLLAKLKALKLDDNTIVILFSDNGGMSGGNLGNPKRVIASDRLDRAFSTSNLPLRGAKGWLYEGGIREPLIVHWPHQGQLGKVCDVPVISTDFYPSILEMVGLPLQPKQHADGVSFAPLVKGARTLDREAIYWHFPHYSNHGMQSPGGAVRAGDYKLLEYYENNTVQLFNLREDIGEQTDLSRAEPAKVTQLRTMLHAWRNDVSAQMMVPNPEYDPGEKP